MHINDQLSDSAVLQELGTRIAKLRLSRNTQQIDLADQAGVGLATLQRLESGTSVSLTTLVRVLRALGRLEGLDIGIPSPLPSPVDQLRLGSRDRQRSRLPGSSAPKPDGGSWRWGDQEADSG
jgi:transcriptional regulator with XRE-family HTH domain